MDRAVIALNDPGDALDQLVIFHRALMRTWMLRAKMRDPRDRQSSLHYGAISTTAAVLPPFRKRKSLIDYAKAQVPCSHLLFEYQTVLSYKGLADGTAAK